MCLQRPVVRGQLHTYSRAPNIPLDAVYVRATSNGTLTPDRSYMSCPAEPFPTAARAPQADS